VDESENPPQGFIFYKGASQINGKPIVGIAVGLKNKSKNEKTGGMIQTYILADGFKPTQALVEGQDAAVCGNCIHRKADGGIGSCYVNVSQGPSSVYKAYKRGNYTVLPQQAVRSLLSDRIVRMGTYGDPTAIPLPIWENALSKTAGWTGYTHQWRRAIARGFEQYCMASTETVEQTELARKRGWRTYRIRTGADDKILKGEFECPASKEAGNRLTCETCLACDGGNPKKVSPTIIVHGISAKVKHLRDTVERMKKKRKYRGMYAK